MQHNAHKKTRKSRPNRVKLGEEKKIKKRKIPLSGYLSDHFLGVGDERLAEMAQRAVQRLDRPVEIHSPAHLGRSSSIALHHNSVKPGKTQYNQVQPSTTR